MLASGTPIVLGYLAFVELSAHGIVGGYLLVNEHARPLEFHCTAPVCPTRTHEILYGPTLREVLCAEQIGPALVSKTKQAPSLVLTDEVDARALQSQLRCPLGVLQEAGFTTPDVGQQAALTRALARVRGDWDLAEPLSRIRAAIEEAQRAAA